MMKSAESSAGLAPSTVVTQSGALSMIAGTAPPLLLAAVPPEHPAREPADDDDHDHDAEHEVGHVYLLTSVSAPIRTGSDSTTRPSGSTIPSTTRPCSGWTSVSYSAMSRPSTSTSGGTRSRFIRLSTHDAVQPVRKPSGRNVAIPMSWPPIELSTLLMPVG